MKKPTIPLQSEPAECGLIAISALTSLYGASLSIGAMKDRFGTSNRGLTISQLLMILREAGFGATAIILEKTRLSELKRPAIALWEDRHFVVIAEVTKSGVQIFDPERGWCVESVEEAASKISGLGVEVSEVPPNPLIPTRVPLNLLSWLKTFKIGSSLARICAIALVAQAVAITVPMMAGRLIDSSLTPGAASVMLYALVGLVCASIVGIVIGSAASRVAARLSNRLMVMLSDDAASRVLAKPLDFLARNVPGVLAGKVHTVQSVQSILVRLTASSLISGLIAIVGLAIILYTNPILGVTLLVFRSLGVFADRPLMQLLAQRMERRFRALTIYNTRLTETIRAAASIRAAQSMGESVRILRKQGEDLAAANISTHDASQARADLGGLVDSLEYAAFLGIGAIAIANGSLTLGTFIALGIYREYVRSGFSEAQNVASDIVSLRTASGRLEEIVVNGSPKPTFTSASQSRTEPGGIEFRDVWFRYSAFDPWILKGFTEHIREGECVAIVGPSGCGKSTLASLCVGALRVHSGAILVGEQEIRPDTVDGVLGRVGTVMQNDHLITASIYENITMRRTVPLERVREAAAAARIDDFIESLPMKYETPISDDFAGLSGGQRQRILIARALCRLPRVLIMDEATSALDQATERDISEHIRRMNMTRIIFAHRAETIAIADRIIDLSGVRPKGRDAEELVA